MVDHITLASKSTIRAQLLKNAGVQFEQYAAKVDEQTMKVSLIAEQASPRDIADALAEMKASRVSAKRPDHYVIGCDQVLAFDRHVISKSESAEDALGLLKKMRGRTHTLLSAAVIYQDGEPKWRHVGQTRMHMRACSDSYLQGYIDRNWEEVQYCVGHYQLEGEGVRLFERVEGDYFNVLGLPLIEVLSYLTRVGVLEQ